jgi:hypothetical protein
MVERLECTLSTAHSITHDMSAAVSAWLHSWHCISMRQSVSSSEIESLLSQINRDLTANRLVCAYRDPRVRPSPPVPPPRCDWFPSRVPPSHRDISWPRLPWPWHEGHLGRSTRAYQLTTPRGVHSAKPRTEKESRERCRERIHAWQLDLVCVAASPYKPNIAAMQWARTWWYMAPHCQTRGRSPGAEGEMGVGRCCVAVLSKP